MEILEVLKNVKVALERLSDAREALVEKERMLAEISYNMNYGGGTDYDYSDVDTQTAYIKYMETAAAGSMKKALSGIDENSMDNADFGEIQKLLDEINSLILK